MEARAAALRRTPLYDSSRQRTSSSDALSVWPYRRLILVLVRNNVRARYKRSVLGLWWALLNPLLTMSVLWVVFSQLFKFAVPGVPFVVYLLSGLVVALLFEQVVTEVASSLVANAAVLTKVYVPPAVFSLAGALTAGVNFGFTLVPLVIIQLAVGVPVPWTAALIVLPAAGVLAFATGVGLMLAPLAARFEDILHMTGVGLTMVFYLTPVIYPLSIVPERFRGLIEANPQYHFVTLFRDLLYGGHPGPWTRYALVAGLGMSVSMFGGWVFSRGWRQAIANL